MAYDFKTFPNLKTLAINYPNVDEDIDAVLMKKFVLVKFPNLENLQLLHFRGSLEENWGWA